MYVDNGGIGQIKGLCVTDGLYIDLEKRKPHLTTNELACFVWDELKQKLNKTGTTEFTTYGAWTDKESDMRGSYTTRWQFQGEDLNIKNMDLPAKVYADIAWISAFHQYTGQDFPDDNGVSTLLMIKKFTDEGKIENKIHLSVHSSYKAIDYQCTLSDEMSYLHNFISELARRSRLILYR